MRSILKRISPISSLKTKILNKQSKISFNLDESEMMINNKFGLSNVLNSKNKMMNSSFSNVNDNISE